MIKSCLEVLNNDAPIYSINSTLIVLVPKVKEARKVTEFRPTSLCNFICKIISKCLANRLKTTLETVTSDNHGAFVGGRKIQDNSIIGCEGLFSMKNDRCGNGKAVALKLDMAKAYD